MKVTKLTENEMQEWVQTKDINAVYKNIEVQTTQNIKGIVYYKQSLIIECYVNKKINEINTSILVESLEHMTVEWTSLDSKSSSEFFKAS